MRPPAFALHALPLACAAALACMAVPAAAQGTLPTVSVTGQHDAETLAPAAPGGKAAQGLRLGVLGNTDILDAPFSATAYTHQAIQDRQARTLADVLQADPSVRYTTNSGHMLEHFRIRGLDVNGPSVAYGGLYGMAPKGHIPTEMIERVEVLRGPSALLGGMSPDSNLGGTINLAPKRATSQPLTQLTTSYSSDSYVQAHADVGRRFGEEGRLGLRFNGAYGSGETGVADQRKGRRLGALALDYQGNDWNVTLDAYTSQEKMRNGSQAMYGLATRRGSAVGIGRLVPVPDGDVNAFRGTRGTFEDDGVMLRGEWRLSPDWTAYAAAGAVNSHGQGLMFGTRMIVTGEGGAAKGYVYNVDTITRDRVAEAGLRGQFATGAVKHTLNVTASVLNHKDGSSSRAAEGWDQNIYEPVTPPFPAAPAPASFSIDNDLRSLAVIDTLDMADGRVLLTLGARLQNVKQINGYDESRVSPSAGLVVKPWGDNTSLFANYMEGLTPGQIVPFNSGYVNEGQAFAPYRTKQVELGVKHRQGALTHTLSAFQIDRPTLITAADGRSMFEGGKQRLRGVEWTAFGQIAPTLDLLGGATWMQAEQRNTGKDSYGVPEWTANVGLDWATPVAGLSVGGRVVYTGRQWVDAANTLRLPSWHRFDLSAKYATRLGSVPVTFNGYVENLTDRAYWSGMFADGYAMPAPPRTLRLAATFAF
ncbi:TonB-dependent receptor [Pulveribacter sp.]|uniref:TonB-dependent receptor n=1 Tax=Pulveribacter sp. TaxID=2678893 RepID=UPI0028A6620F|nr:TonB-dependent receptor [Pulveribacter sp.]